MAREELALADCGKPRVLIVEDDKATSKAFTLRLEAHGYEVLTSVSASWGTTMGVFREPDLLLLDVHLGSGNGFDVAENVRRELPQTPIIFISGDRSATVRQKALSFADAWFLEKPFTTAFLLHTLRQALGADTVA